MRRRVLVLAPFPPRLDAPHGGGVTIARSLARLAERNDVALLCLRGRDEPGIDESLAARLAHAEAVGRLTLRDSPTVLVTERQRYAMRLNNRPPWVVGHAVRRFSGRLLELQRDWCPDVVQAEMIVMGQYLSRGRDHTAAIIVHHDPLPSEDRRAWEEETAIVTSRADAVVVFTREDELRVAPFLCHASLRRIAPPVWLPRALDARGREGEVLLVGSFAHDPNVTAARWLLSDVWPRVRTRVNDATLTICGADPPADIVSDIGRGVVVTGKVDDVEPYLDRAAVVVAPIVDGGGLRIKVMEALGGGKALVATPRAVEGFEVQPGDNVLIAETADTFANAVVGLLEDPHRRARLGASGRALAERMAVNDDFLDAYDALYEAIVQRTTA